MYHYLVYQTTNKINNKIYIGVHATEDIDDRYLGSGTHLTRAVRKHGKEHFERKILFECESSEEMFEKEREIVNLEFVSRDDNYNLRVGGLGHGVGKDNPMYGVRGKDHPIYGRKASEESKKKMSLAHLGKNHPMYGITGKDHPNYGRKHTEKSKKKMSLAKIGKKHSEETKKKMSLAGIGKKHTEETRNKMSESKIGFINEKLAKTYILTTPDGEKIRIVNLHKWCRDHPEYGLLQPSLCDVASGKRKHHRGWKCRKVDD